MIIGLSLIILFLTTFISILLAFSLSRLRILSMTLFPWPCRQLNKEFLRRLLILKFLILISIVRQKLRRVLYFRLNHLRGNHLIILPFKLRLPIFREKYYHLLNRFNSSLN